MAINTNDMVPLESAHAFAGQPGTLIAVGLASDDGLDQFQSESEPSVPYVPRDSRYARVLAPAAVAVLLALVVTLVLVRTRSGGEYRVNSLPVGVLAGHAPSKAVSSPSPAVRAAAGDAAVGEVRHAPATAAPPPPVKRAAAVRRPRSGVSRPTRRQSVVARAVNTPSTQGAQLPSGSVSEPATVPLPAAALAHTVTAGEPTAPKIGTQVSVTTSNPNSDELTFRWSAPEGTFADPTASRTRFFCPATPQPVAVTVAVTDGNGAVASDTITVQCVASMR